jgi:hypothetical protein
MLPCHWTTKSHYRTLTRRIYIAVAVAVCFTAVILSGAKDPEDLDSPQSSRTFPTANSIVVAVVRNPENAQIYLSSPQTI